MGINILLLLYHCIVYDGTKPVSPAMYYVVMVAQAQVLICFSLP